MHKYSKLKDPFKYYWHKIQKHRCKYYEIPAVPPEKNFDGVRFVFDMTLDYHIKRMYFGLYEPELRKFLKKHLKPGDVFFDIGANVGYMSAIGASLVGKDGKIHSFEPVPKYFEQLLQLSKLNPDYNITVNNFALGESSREAFIDLHRSNIGMNSIVPGFVPEEDILEKLAVKMISLDEYLNENNIHKISFIKIDTEGYELPVLKGAKEFFNNNKSNLPLILAEVSTTSYELMNCSIKELDDFMKELGYKAYDALTKKRINLLTLKKQHDILFLN